MSRRLPRHPTLLAAALLVLGALLAVAAPRGRAQDTGATTPTGCAHVAGTQVRHGPTTGRRIALTFDDGPAALTPQFLTLLEQEHVPATFFIVGRRVAGREATLRRALADGDMLGNHSFDHVSLQKADTDAVAQIEDTQKAISDATGFTPCLLRPPFGLSSKSLIRLANSEGLTPTLWSVNPQDFTRPGTAKIRSRVLAGAKPGAIILSHDGGGPRQQTLSAYRTIIRTLKARGYRFVTVTDLLGLTVTRR